MKQDKNKQSRFHLLNRMKLITVFSLLVNLAILHSNVLAYGLKDEACTKNGTIIKNSQNPVSIIQTGRPGDTFLLRGGTYKLSSHINMPSGTTGKPITVKPYNCEQVTISTQNKRINLNSYTLIAGLEITGRNTPVEVRSNSDRPIQNAVIRNNHIQGNEKAVGIGGNVKDTQVIGNALLNPKGRGVNGALTLSCKQRSGYKPDNTLIEANHFFDCGEDCIQFEETKSFKIVNNKFEGPVKENLMDIKTIRENSSIKGNHFKCSSIQKDCVVLHGEVNTNAQVTFEANVLDGCPSTSRRLVYINGKKSVENTYHLIKNIFNLSNTGCEAVRYQACKDCNLYNNTFYNGEIQLGSSGHPGPKALNISNNILFQSKINNRHSSIRKCYNNIFYKPSGSFNTSCTQTESNNPLFVNTSKADFSLQSGSPAINAGIDVGLPFSGHAPDIGAVGLASPSSAPGVFAPRELRTLTP